MKSSSAVKSKLLPIAARAIRLAPSTCAFSCGATETIGSDTSGSELALTNGELLAKVGEDDEVLVASRGELVES